MLYGAHGLIENQIKEWVRRTVCHSDKDNGRCKKLLLRHLNLEKKPQSDVHTVTLSGDPAVEGTEVADRVISDIAEYAQRDANDLNSGIQVYAIYAEYTGNPNYKPRKVFRVASDDEVVGDSEASEPATEKGLLSQLMRHNEINSKNSLVAMGYILQTFQKEISQQREQNKIFMGQQIDMTILVQDVLNEGHKRRLEEKESEIKVSMMEGAFEHLKIGLPILFNRLAGKDVFPAKMDRELYLMAAMFETMTPDQQEQLTKLLKPQQLAMLGELLGMYEERKGKFAQQNTSSGAEPPSPEENDEEAPTPGSSKLLAMFEKRSSLINTEKILESDDAKTRRIEAAAAKVRDRLSDVSKLVKKDE